MKPGLWRAAESFRHEASSPAHTAIHTRLLPVPLAPGLSPFMNHWGRYMSRNRPHALG